MVKMLEDRGESLTALEVLVAEGLEHEGEERETWLLSLRERSPQDEERVRERLSMLGDFGLSATAGVARRGTPLREELRVGHFVLKERVGIGGMGEVWRATDGERTVALKLVRPELLWFEGARKRFAREASAAAALDHPGIVSLIEFGEEGGLPWMALDWVPGKNLDAVLELMQGRPPESLGRLDFLDALDSGAGRDGKRQVPDLEGEGYPALVALLLARVADALAHAHSRGVIHRDVKPSNILVTSAGEVRLVDFGLAMTREGTKMTRTGSWLGSLPYAAPEQVEGLSDLDGRVDVYSLGATLYECLTLHTPFIGGGESLVRARILTGDLEALRRLNPGVSRGLELVCQKAMDPDRNRRYADASELAADLRRAARREPVTARSVPLWLRSARWSRRHARLAVWGGILIATLIASMAWAVRERLVSNRIMRMADAEMVGRMMRESNAFWPPDPLHLVDKEDWLGRADELLARREIHAAGLASLRERAMPYDLEQAELDSGKARVFLLGMRLELEGLGFFFAQQRSRRERTRPAAADVIAASMTRWEEHIAVDPSEFVVEFRTRIHEVREFLLQSQLHGELDHNQLADFERLLDEHGPELFARHQYRFEGEFDQWRHDELSHLLGRFDELEARGQSVRELVVSCREVAGCQQEVERAWSVVFDSMRTSEKYDRLSLELDPCLMPLHENPVTGLWEFFLLGSGEAPLPEPSAEDPARLRIGPETGVVLVLLPRGEFQMGLPEDGEDGVMLASHPSHPVQLEAFFISKYELTMAQSERLGAPRDRAINFEDPHRPVSVNWYASQKLLRSHGFDHPTEAQWEYAARAGRERAATAVTDEVCANVRDLAWESAQPRVTHNKVYAPYDDGFAQLAPVGSFLPNDFGLYDCRGNVSEWCLEWWVGRGYSTLPSRPGDGLKESVFKGPGRITRGGSYTSHLGECNFFHRIACNPAASQSCGVRPVRRLRLR